MCIYLWVLEFIDPFIYLLLCCLNFLADSSCTCCVHTFETDIFCSAMEQEKKSASREENGYLYLLAPELLSRIPRGWLTQCSTNWCSWRSGRVICSIGGGDKLYLSAHKVLIRLLHLRFSFKHHLGLISIEAYCSLWCHIIFL